MFKKKLLAALFCCAALSATPSTYAASFDCNQAKAVDEKTVCANRALNDLDVKMAVLYSLDRKFLPMGGRDDLISQQQDWLKSRASCGANVSCLTDSYERRIQVLQKIIDTRVVTKGPF
ncbi:lysozyme inhibitor LprI family protein [Pseudomonas sp. NPDC086278]|uniref:lysozyme inhibitor LprI family protein n=1 Tax=Pseudomonas sp. NPDC086278 TaxID=3390646 RepID=UPI003D01DC6D